MSKDQQFVVALLAFAVLVIIAINVKESNQADQVETKADQLWCRAEIQHQLENVEDTALISIDDIMVTYQVCVDNIDEFPRNAFQGTVYEMP